MNPTPSAALAAAAALLATAAAPARPGEERWSASSRTALGVTGDIVLSPAHLRMRGADFPLRVAADLPLFEGEEGPVPARILEVTRPIDPMLRNGNRLGCGRPIRWIAAWRRDRGPSLALALATFTGPRRPTGIHAPGFCGTYYYVRGR